MPTASLHDGHWSSVISRLSEVVDLEATARPFGALKRARKVRSAEDLLRLAFLSGPAHLSLHSTAAMAEEVGIGALSDKAVLGRLRQTPDWLEHVLQCLLAHTQPLLAAPTDGLQLALVDGSVVRAPGSKGPSAARRARRATGSTRAPRWRRAI